MEGARAEIELTPKPGLVDRHDNGSHPDLSYEKMMRSCELLGRYYEDLAARHHEAASRIAAPDGQISEGSFRALALPSCVAAGREAEERMIASIGANAHRGYIFISGLVILAACDIEARGGCVGRPSLDHLRKGIGGWARAFFARAPAEMDARDLPGGPDTHDLPGGRVRARLEIGGIRAETESGLAVVIDDALPALRRAYDATGDRRAASYLAMARLMQTVEDTTAVRRCGIAGLARLRRDGAALERRLLEGEAPDEVLAQWNEEYRAIRLTMGGVADCLALTFAMDAMS
jgi:triphosphoribosyl-dephospho-CoA synthase